MMYQLCADSLAIISTGGSSNLGRMLMRYSQSMGLNVINVVKSLNEEKLLRDEGAKLILNVH